MNKREDLIFLKIFLIILSLFYDSQGNVEIRNFVHKAKQIIRIVTIYMFDADLVWRMQLMIIKGSKFVLCVFLTFNSY